MSSTVKPSPPLPTYLLNSDASERISYQSTVTAVVASHCRAVKMLSSALEHCKGRVGPCLSLSPSLISYGWWERNVRQIKYARYRALERVIQIYFVMAAHTLTSLVKDLYYCHASSVSLAPIGYGEWEEDAVDPPVSFIIRFFFAKIELPYLLHTEIYASTVGSVR